MQDCSVECRIVQLNANFRQFSVQRLKSSRIALIITEGMHGRLHANAWSFTCVVWRENAC